MRCYTPVAAGLFCPRSKKRPPCLPLLHPRVRFLLVLRSFRALARFFLHRLLAFLLVFVFRLLVFALRVCAAAHTLLLPCVSLLVFRACVRLSYCAFGGACRHHPLHQLPTSAWCFWSARRVSVVGYHHHHQLSTMRVAVCWFSVRVCVCVFVHRHHHHHH